MRVPGRLLARYQTCGGISTHIAESASKPPGFGRAIVGSLRRLEAHEAFIDVTVNAFEVRWWGAKGGESRIARVDDLDGGLDSYSAMSDYGKQSSASAGDCMRNAAERESWAREGRVGVRMRRS
jgi:hypothetical protein